MLFENAFCERVFDMDKGIAFDMKRRAVIMIGGEYSIIRGGGRPSPFLLSSIIGPAAE